MAKAPDTSKSLRRAEEALQRKNYDLAILSYLHALKYTPEDLDTRLKLRAVQARKMRDNGASKLGARWNLFKAGFAKGPRAMELCEYALSSWAECVPAMKKLAVLAEKENLPALASWQRQQLADNFTTDDVDNLEQLCRLYEEQDRIEEAVNALLRVRQIDPNADVGPELTRLEALKSTSIFTRGASEGARAIVKDADEMEKLELDSQRLRTDDQREKAIQHLRANDLRERPDDHRLYLRIGEIYMDLDDAERGFAEAEKAFGKAHELAPADNTVLDRMGDLEARRQKRQIEELQKRMEAAPSDAGLRDEYRKASTRFVQTQITEYERRVKAQPLKSDFHYRLGELYFKTQRFDEAVSELQTAAKDPKYRIAALTNLGRSFMQTEQLDMAIAQFQKAREGQEVFQKIRDPLYFEAQALERKGDEASLRRALDIYTQIYQIDINFRDVRRKVPDLQKRLGV